MAVAAGAGLILVSALGRLLVTGRSIVAEGWALAFGTLGLLLTVTGLHMTLTWPLSSIAPFDNIIFGEPSLAFGVLLLTAAFFLWRSRERLAVDEAPDARLTYLRRVAQPISIFVGGLGLGLIGIAAAGWRFTLFAAPTQEPISGNFANHPLLEATFISGLYLLVAIGAILFPIAVWRMQPIVVRLTGAAWAVGGIIFILFGALNYFTHIGLIIHTT